MKINKVLKCIQYGFIKFILIYLIAAPISSAQSIEDLSFGTDSTFEAITWNIEHFPKNGEITLDYVAQIIKTNTFLG